MSINLKISNLDLLSSSVKLNNPNSNMAPEGSSMQTTGVSRPRAKAATRRILIKAEAAMKVNKIEDEQAAAAAAETTGQEWDGTLPPLKLRIYVGGPDRVQWTIGV
ncbi:hypothetical protein EJ06DRAFT_519679 [Trichodelitschia bisporula]|uniref:Uncharacterized protein n=1 Tax=Trichodelitschia bisporula TaxID=703511 RepID=A0A6G1I7L4_9PEZI|nr:hypothetical protein EJ06DRAFT_519679 [Trichodelitschia bisporula]